MLPIAHRFRCSRQRKLYLPKPPGRRYLTQKCGLDEAYVVQDSKQMWRLRLTTSCAIMPPMLMPITCSWRLSVQPRWSMTSITSFAISDVEYLPRGLSESPIPRWSYTRHEYLSPCACPKSFVCLCQAYFMPPRPIIHCLHVRKSLIEVCNKSEKV